MKKFTEKLEKWAQARDKSSSKKRNSLFIVEFLAVKNDVIEAIEARYPLFLIWEYFKETGQIRTTYETFRQHVKRFIKSETQNQKILAAKMTAKNSTLDSEQQTGHKPKSSLQKPQTGVRGFNFQAKPNPEDLI